MVKIRLPENLQNLLRRRSTWAVAVGLVVVVIVGFVLTRDSRIPEKAGFPDESLDPVFKDPQRPATAFCPRSDYTLKWIAWDGEFVPRCVPKHPAPVETSPTATSELGSLMLLPAAILVLIAVAALVVRHYHSKASGRPARRTSNHVAEAQEAWNRAGKALNDDPTKQIPY